MADVTDVLSGVVGGLVVGVAILVLDWLRRRGEKRDDRAQGLGEAFAATRTTVAELKADADRLAGDVREIQTSLIDLKTSVQAAIHKLDTSCAMTRTRLDESDRLLAKLDNGLAAVKASLERVGEQARTARREAHRHPIIGGEKV